MSNHSVSVVMATYNGERYLAEQLDSILGQTLKPVEIIVCDDRSTDNTIQILEDYAYRGYLSYYINETQLGVVENFKKAASLVTKGSLFAFADQDDIWLPEKFEVLAETLHKDTVIDKPAMVFSDLKTIDKNGNMLTESLWKEFSVDPGKQTFRTLLTRNIATGCTMLMNEAMRLEFLKMPADAYMHDAWVTFLAYAFDNYAYVKTPLICHRNHDTNVLHHEEENKKSSVWAKLYEYFDGIAFNRQLLAKETKMAECFFSMYKSHLSPDALEAFNQFFDIKNKSFLIKKRHIRKVNSIEISKQNS